MPTDNISRSLSNWVKNTIFKSKNLYFMHTCINVIKYYMSFLPYLKICGLATISTNPSKQSHQHCSWHCSRQKMKNQILPNGGISDPHFLRVHRNLRFPVRIGQLYRNDQQLQLKMYHCTGGKLQKNVVVFLAKTMIGQKTDSFYPPKSEGNSCKTNILKSDFKFNDKDIVFSYETFFQTERQC